MRTLATVAMLCLVAGCSKKQPPFQVYGEVPPFVLTAETGREFHSDALAGKVWVADFIFTTCTGPCPRMSSQMHQVQNAVRDLPQVRLVSFTVDPKNDTPDVLAAYAKRFQADPGLWVFLTGPHDTLQMLSRNAFKLSDANLDHSTRFVLIDGRRRIRGYYRSSEPESLRQLIADARRLAAEPG